MQYTTVPTKQFRKDVRRLKKMGADLRKLEQVVRLLEMGRPLGDEYRDHELEGKLLGIRECHIAPDWLLLYQQNQKQLLLLLVRTRTHAKMFRE